MRKTIVAAAAALSLVAASQSHAASGPIEIKNGDWTFTGLFGSFDRAQMKRGFLVYKDVCSACHSLRLVAYRNLQAVGFTEDEIKEIAAEYEVEDGPNDEGEMFLRPARPADRFVPPFANDQAARSANDGSLPPDLSLITKARKHGPDYLYSLLTGYREEPPEGFDLPDGMNYNVSFPGNKIAMAQPLDDEAVEYEDGTPATLDQHAQDVTAFLAWAAEPELEERKGLGIKVMLFLIVITAMLYALKRRIWADVH